MSIRVIVPPAPLLTPSDIPGPHAGDDAGVTRIIAAAQAEIDGPDGWLGRALGPQTIEAAVPDFNWQVFRLPCPPIIEVLSVQYLDQQRVLQTLDPQIWEYGEGEVLRKIGKLWPHAYRDDRAVRIRYRAGYNGTAVADGGTGPVPEQVKQALQLAVIHTMAIGVENLFLRSEDVEGIGTRTYTVSPAAGEIIRTATERFLSGLRLYA